MDIIKLIICFSLAFGVPEVLFPVAVFIVKILYNEKETTIPAISTFHDCYYEWEVLRTHLDKKVR